MGIGLAVYNPVHLASCNALCVLKLFYLPSSFEVNLNAVPQESYCRSPVGLQSEPCSTHEALSPYKTYYFDLIPEYANFSSYKHINLKNCPFISCLVHAPWKICQCLIIIAIISPIHHEGDVCAKFHKRSFSNLGTFNSKTHCIKGKCHD